MSMRLILGVHHENKIINKQENYYSFLKLLSAMVSLSDQFLISEVAIIVVLSPWTLSYLFINNGLDNIMIIS